MTQERDQWVGPIPPPTDTVGNAAFEAYMNQMDIAWDQAFQGRVSKIWRIAIVAYCS